MQKNLVGANQVALITGAARRIGADIARTLHAAGMNVVIHFNTSQKEAESLCAELNKQRGHSAVILQGDLLQIRTITQLVDTAANFWGRLDVLVNNASLFYKTPVGTVTEKSWQDLLDSNLKAPFFLSQAAMPYLKKQDGCIVNIADIHGERPMQEYAVYSIAKAGLIMLTKTLARELGPEIRVNAVSPGAIIWPEGNNVITDEIKQKIIAHTALKKSGHPSEIAKAVLFLVQDANYITGQVLAVDGGRSLFL